MVIIGITGQSGGGKGFLSSEFEKLGYLHADADVIYHTLLQQSDQMKDELVSTFGEDVVKGGKIDRKKLGKKVFGAGNEKKLELLNEITHKYVCNEYSSIIKHAKANGAHGVTVDAPLLIEAGLCDVCDATIFVKCDKELRISRIMERDSIDRESALLRVNSQKDDEFYSSVCDFIFVNSANSDAAEFAKYIDMKFTEEQHEQNA